MSSLPLSQAASVAILPSALVNSAAVFAEALQHYFSELRGIAIEIDEEYSSEPDPVVKPEYTGPPMTLTITNIGEALK